MVVSYYLPIWFQVIQAVSPTTSGVRTLPLLVSQMADVLAIKGPFWEGQVSCTQNL
jgi:hypothetical protein